MIPYDNSKADIIIIAGPTGVGKSQVAVDLALISGGEVISADSMQVYKYMDIGSAKITPTEQRGIPHHLIDIMEPGDSFDVVRFKTLSKECINDIDKRGKLSIIAGGTGFYIQALLYDVDFGQGETGNAPVSLEAKAIRQELELLCKEKGNDHLHGLLTQVDPEAAQAIHPNNVKRVIRALEFYRLTGTKISHHNEIQKVRTPAYNCLYFAINDDRERVYENIDRRVDKMMEAGLVKEVQSLVDMGLTGDMVSMQGLGYKEIYDHLTGKITLEEAVYLIKRDSRHFAKRQLTWLRRERNVIWLNKGDFDYNSHKIAAHIYNKYIEYKNKCNYSEPCTEQLRINN